MRAKILLSGTTGSTGFEVARRLLAMDVPFRAGGRDVGRIRQRLGEKPEALHFDYTDPATYAAAFEGIERMFLVLPPQVSDVRRDVFPALAAAKQAGVKYIVFLSVLDVDKLKFLAHAQVEGELARLGIIVTDLRPGCYMQNFNTFHRAEIVHRGEIFVPAGDGKISFIDVRDVAAVAAVVLTQAGHAGRVYDLTGGEALDYAEAAQCFTEALGRKISYANPSVAAYISRTVARGGSLGAALEIARLHAATRAGKAGRISADVEKLLGRKPITLRQYVQDYRAAWEY